MRPLTALVILAAALGGCGISNPYTSSNATTAAAAPPVSTATATDADPTSERGGSIPRAAQHNQLATNAAEPTPQTALERYARLYINWTANTVATVQHELAAISTGQARAQALQAAASYGHDSTLQASQVANSGSVIAIAAGHGPAAGSWVIVTQETTTGSGDYAGLPPTDHVTDAQLAHTRNGWIVSSWSPLS
ncbi:MAG: hypothetical protein ACLP01_07755 [Solirubrobacteraceae bacterium]